MRQAAESIMEKLRASAQDSKGIEPVLQAAKLCLESMSLSAAPDIELTMCFKALEVGLFLLHAFCKEFQQA